jgi:5-hydroxyisourate hydrolase-like protein (transthyretin family)
LKKPARIVLALVCAAVWAVACFAQNAPNGQAAASADTKSVVQGKVLDQASGQGIRKVKVTLRLRSQANEGRLLYQANEQYEAITDQSGSFRIEGVEPGEYRVDFERPGYAAVKANRPRTVTVTAGQNINDLVLQMLMAGVISGKIVDLDGDPLRNVSVSAKPTGGETRRNFVPSAGGATNDLGEYRIPDLPPGNYVVQATPSQNEVPSSGSNEKALAKQRTIYVTTYYPGTLDEKQAAAVEVTPGGSAIANFGVLTSRAYRVSGTISGLGPAPQGMGMSQLILMGTNGQAAQQNLSEGGNFEFPDVLPGTYHAQLLIVSIGDGRPSMKMQTIRTPIEVNGSDVVGLQLEVDAGGDVSGKFRMDTGEKIDWSELDVFLLTVPQNGETPEVAYAQMASAQPTKIQEDGSFEMKDVPGGNVQLAVGAQSDKFRDYYTKSVLLGGREVADSGFAVNPGMVLDVVVSAKGAGIEGTVLDSHNKPAPDAFVISMPGSGKLGRPDAYQVAQSDDKGHFALRGMNPGTFLVLAFEDMPGNYRAPDFAKQYDGKGQTVELEEGAKKSVVVKLVTDEDVKR